MSIKKDVIRISDLLIRCIIGINDDEREKKQDVLINIELYGDFRRAGESDSIGDAVNYKTITKKVIHSVENSSYHLVETLAEKIAYICLEDKHCQTVQVKVEKPGALRFADKVGITIQRERAVNQYTVGISGNLNPLIYLPAAVRKLKTKTAIDIVDISRVFITKPEKQRDQEPYRNGAMNIETKLNQSELNKILKSVETDCLRVKGKDKYESRTVDLDILVENGNIIDKDVANRWYLQVLLAELKGIIYKSNCNIPENPVIDHNMTETLRNICSL